jgi:hypothetical protein
VLVAGFFVHPVGMDLSGGVVTVPDVSDAPLLVSPFTVQPAGFATLTFLKIMAPLHRHQGECGGHEDRSQLLDAHL